MRFFFQEEQMPPIALPEFADKLNEILPELSRQIVSQSADELFKGKITLPQFFLMSLLRKEGELKMTDIARLLHVTTAAATGVVERLVNSGYLLRVYDPDDRRIIKVKLSPRGLNTVLKVLQERRKMIIDIFSRISPEDRQKYLEILMRVQQIMREQNGAANSHG
jgi:DNA-binding MarR family transcriptional regulator